MSSRESKREPQEYAKFVLRCMRALGRQIDAGDIDALPVLLALRDEIDAEIPRRVAALRSEDGGAYSWGEIAKRLNVSPQAVQQKYGSKTAPGARRPGGQPAHLR